MCAEDVEMLDLSREVKKEENGEDDSDGEDSDGGVGGEEDAEIYIVRDFFALVEIHAAEHSCNCQARLSMKFVIIFTIGRKFGEVLIAICIFSGVIRPAIILFSSEMHAIYATVFKRDVGLSLNFFSLPVLPAFERNQNS